MWCACLCTCQSRSRHIQTCQRCSHSRTVSTVYFSGSRGPGNRVHNINCIVQSFVQPPKNTSIHHTSQVSICKLVPGKFPEACSPCWRPTPSLWGSHGSLSNVRCGWTLHLRWRRWFLRRMNDYWGLLVPRTLMKENNVVLTLKTRYKQINMSYVGLCHNFFVLEARALKWLDYIKKYFFIYYKQLLLQYLIG